MIRPSRWHVIVAVCFAVAMQSTAGAQDQETMYYANAYADHYGVPRALDDAIIEQE